MSYSLRLIDSTRTHHTCDEESRSISVTSFYGGSTDGRCIQLTLAKEFVGLTESDVRRLVSVLTLWLDPDIQSEEIEHLFI